DAFDAFAVISDYGVAAFVVEKFGELVVTDVDERIPLVVISGVLAQPGSDGFLFCVAVGHVGIAEGGSGKLHIVRPIVFGIDVRRKYGGSLADAGFIEAEPEGGSGFLG